MHHAEKTLAEHRRSGRVTKSSLGVAMAIGLASPAMAVDFNTGESGIKASVDTTVKYTSAWRLRDPDANVVNGNDANPNTDFGDQGFSKGQQINNRLDLYSELNISRGDLGLRVSGAAWYDTVYRRAGNHAPTTGAPNTWANLSGAARNALPEDTRELMGRKAELLDAFVFGSAGLGEGRQVNARLGRHAVTYGETLFLGANGVAGVMAPVDLVKLYSLPTAQYKEIARPVGQASADVQLRDGWSLGAYYQYQWVPLRVPAVGSYFSIAEFVGEGRSLFLNPFGINDGVGRVGHDMKGKSSGQYGGRVRFKPVDGNAEYGVYAGRYNDRAPIAVYTMQTNTLVNAYANDIKYAGASVSTVVGETNVAAEISTRRNTPLAVPGDATVAFGPTDNESNTAYARGNSLHLNLSAIAVFAATPLWQGASLVGEYAYNRLLSVTWDPVARKVGLFGLNDSHSRDAHFVRAVFTASYFQVLPGIDLDVPVGVGHGISGRSAVFQAMPEHGGDLTIGAVANVKNAFRVGLNYTRYTGSGGMAPKPGSFSASYKNYYRDRDFIALTLQSTF